MSLKPVLAKAVPAFQSETEVQGQKYMLLHVKLLLKIKRTKVSSLMWS